MSIVIQVANKQDAQKLAKRIVNRKPFTYCNTISLWSKGVFQVPISNNTKAIYRHKMKFWTVEANSKKSNAEILKELKEEKC